MSFNDIELQRIKKEVGGFCLKRCPEYIRDKVRLDYKIDNRDVIIIEIRPRWNNPDEIIETPIAKIKYILSQKIWELYWQRANMKWVKYDQKKSSKSLSELVQEIDSDPFGIFWG